MKRERKQLETVVLLTGILLVAMMIVTSGCKKEPAPAPAPPAGAVETASAAIEQKTCPIMDGNPINKAVYTEHEGKKVYFCCPACIKKFKADPEKYVANLPQFKD